MRKRLILGAICLLMAGGAAQSALRVEITEGVSGALPIAVVPFDTPGATELPLDIAGVVEADLRGSGLFDPMKRGQMIGKPSRADEVNYTSWRALDMDNLVVGSVAQRPEGGYRINFQIVDVVQQRPATGYQITAEAGELRDAAHTVSNLVYEHFIGQKGYFLSQIAYVTVNETEQGLSYRLMVSDYDGHDPQTLARSRFPIMSPAWSPDGTKLAYVAFDVDIGRTRLQVHDLRTGEVKTISSRPGINGAPAWSPDGSQLAMTLSFRGNPDIYVYDRERNEFRQLTFNAAIDTEPTWSPDGDHIAFTSDRGGKPQIYRVASGGGRAERVTFAGESNQRAVYSPDGDYMTMVQGGPNGFRIAVLNLETNNVRIVSDGPLDESPSFAPNGRTIIYAQQGDGSAGLATVSIDGRVRTRLRQSGEVREPAWGPAGY